MDAEVRASRSEPCKGGAAQPRLGPRARRLRHRVALSTGPLLDERRRCRTRGRYFALTIIVAAELIVARSVVLAAISAVVDIQPLDSPLNILVTGLTALGLVALAITVVERRRVSHPRTEGAAGGAPRRLGMIALYFVAGALAGLLAAVYEQFLQRVVTRTHLDVLHFSLHPIDVPRFAVDFGLS